ncbi:class II glutamine amidotransferase [Nocardioides jiangxiensis]|uniref:Class II glutamine amidotransferase n=1 Tax=Nocardioides jiangxiensis TaxID=3064524 RepID=A0ABT9AYA2_9ACTN|nr:class II glutamine amidotransferase [Nocardioides sp. WY-20]MDO7867045.1 class II glutamine amidotransferase [Nocardioides sp. WY-20]
MCRLLGYVTDEPTSLVDLLGQEDFDAFTALTVVHDDGWGMAWRDQAGRLQRRGSACSAAGDPAYADLAAQPLGRAGIVHLRWASPGIAVRAENTHPFVAGDLAMAHNGHIAPVDRLERLLTPASRAVLRGDTDSERYFRYVLQCIEAAGDEAVGLGEAVATLEAEFPYASLNALLLTPARLLAVHVNSHASPPPALKGLGIAAERIRHTDDEYFAMDFRRSPEGVQLISSGIDPEGWEPVPEDSIGIVDLAARSLEWRIADQSPTTDAQKASIASTIWSSPGCSSG